MIKKHSEIIVFLLVAALVSFYISYLETKDSSHQKVMESYSDSIKVLNKKYFLLKQQEVSLRDSLSETLNKLKATRESITIIKQQSYEKADSVYNLSNNESLLFLTEWLSKRDSVK